jgi:hypothetical protein
MSLIPQNLGDAESQRSFGSTRRYQLLPQGYSICPVFLKLFERVYAPLSAGLLRSLDAPHQQLMQAAVQRHVPDDIQATVIAEEPSIYKDEFTINHNPRPYCEAGADGWLAKRPAAEAAAPAKPDRPGRDGPV